MLTKTRVKAYWWIGAGVLAAAVILAAVVLLLPREETAPPTETTAEETTLPPPSENVYTSTDFGYDNGYLTCLTDTSILGIDVSVHQGNIDWAQVKAAGVEFVIIRLAYRGSIEGALSTDEMAQINYEGAKAAGLKVGGYIFTQSISAEEGIEDARYVMDIVKDWELDMPLVYDWEIVDESYRNGQLDMRTLTDTMKAFCQTVEASGYDAMIYFNPSQSKQNFYMQELTDYGFWLAHYSDEMTFPYKVDMWQYTCTGSVPGVEGNVDIDLYFPYE